METGSITIKDIVGWIVAILISLVPTLIEIRKLKIMLYKEIIARKDLEIKYLKKENSEDKKTITDLKNEVQELRKKLSN